MMKKLIISALLFSVMFCSRSLALDYSGLAYPCHSQTDYDISEPNTIESLNWLIMKTGINTIEIVPSWYMADATDINIFRGEGTATDEQVEDIIDQAHSQGWKVVLKPQIEILDGSSRADIAPLIESQWMFSYIDFINVYASIANTMLNSDDIFVVGTGLKSMSYDTTMWATLIQIAKAATGNSLPVTYAADYDEYQNIGFWSFTDVIGINGFFPLADAGTDPNTEALKDSLNQHLQDISDWRTTNSLTQPVLFTELGFLTTENAHENPSDSNVMNMGSYSEEIQLRCYEAAYEVFSSPDWVDGIIFWALPPDLAEDFPSEVGISGDASYLGYSPVYRQSDGSIYAKQSAKVLKPYYPCSDESIILGDSVLIPPNPSAANDLSYWEYDFKTDSTLTDEWAIRDSDSAIAHPGPQRWSPQPDYIELVDDNGTEAVRLSVIGDVDYSTGAEISSLEQFGFGRYTCRMRAEGDWGFISSLLLYFNGLAEDSFTEIEVDIASRLFDCNEGELVLSSWQESVDIGLGGEDIKQTVQRRLSDMGLSPTDYQEYAIDWTSDAVVFYVNGAEIARINDYVPWNSAHIILSTFSGGRAGGYLNENESGDFYIDWIRYEPAGVEELTETQMAIQSGIGWLRSQQLPNGSWSDKPGVSSLALLAILDYGYAETDPVVSDGVDYLLANLNPDGSVGSDSNLANYYTSSAILPLIATRNEDYINQLELMRGWLIDTQLDEDSLLGSVDINNVNYGGFGYGNSMTTDLSNTQWSLFALYMTDNYLVLDANQTYEQALQFLANCMNENGGSGFMPAEDSIHTMTAASVLSYILCGLNPEDTEVAEGTQWLADDYTVVNTDGWGSQSDYFYALTLARAMTFSGRKFLAGNAWYSDLAAEYISRQTPQGNWPESGWLTGQADLELNTALTILALQTRTLSTQADFDISMVLESHADLHIWDEIGRHTGFNYGFGVIDQNIPGSTFQLLDANGIEIPYDGNTPEEGTSQVANLTLTEGAKFHVELIGTSDGPYNLTINGIVDGNVVSTFIYDSNIVAGQLLSTDIIVTSVEGQLSMFAEPLEEGPAFEVDRPSQTFMEPNSTGQYLFQIREVTGQANLQNVTLHTTDWIGPNDLVIPAGDFSFSTNNFIVSAGASRIITVDVNFPDSYGEFIGTIYVETANGGTKSITDSIIGNTPPTADAGNNETIEVWPNAQGREVGTITLDGTGSFDPDPNQELTYSWTQAGNEIGTGLTPTVELGVGFNGITLSVSDGFETSRASVIITVNPPLQAVRMVVSPITINRRNYPKRIMVYVGLPMIKGINWKTVSNEPLVLVPSGLVPNKQRHWGALRVNYIAFYNKLEFTELVQENGRMSLHVYGKLKSGRTFKATRKKVRLIK